MSQGVPYPKRQKHHYIPEFYLKQWAAEPDGRLCEFCQRYKGIVKWRMTYPGGTGYVENLYTLAGFPAETAQLIENKFFRATDQSANDALNILLNGDISDIPADVRSGWSRFVLSLIHRNPEKIAWIKTEVRRGLNARLQEVKENYEKFRRPEDPHTFEDYVARGGANAESKAFAMLLQAIVDSQNVGDYLSGMRWSVLTIERPTHSLLTSDRPVVVSNGIKYGHSYIIVPLSPISLFLAVNTIQMEQHIRSLPVMDFVHEVNNIVCKQAQKFVYGTDNRQLRFVANRLGRGVPQFIASKRPTPLPTLTDLP
jgi:hypothetical protein